MAVYGTLGLVPVVDILARFDPDFIERLAAWIGVTGD